MLLKEEIFSYNLLLAQIWSFICCHLVSPVIHPIKWGRSDIAELEYSQDLDQPLLGSSLYHDFILSISAEHCL